MKKLFILTLFITLSPVGKAQNLNSAKNISYLSSEEKKVIYLINFVRHDGQKFAKEYLDKYVADRHMKDNKFVQSLYKDLRQTTALTSLLPSKELTNASNYHAKDMGKLGKTGHNSTDGTSFSKRLRRYVSRGAIAENCSYGYSDAIEIVMQLLIDEGISSLGHRKNILDSRFKYIGVAIEPHTYYGYNCVQDFSN